MMEKKLNRLINASLFLTSLNSFQKTDIEQSRVISSSYGDFFSSHAPDEITRLYVNI